MRSISSDCADEARNIKVVVSYDGTDYFGFQYQPKVPTVEGELRKALSKVLKENAPLWGAGRTDAGVHALGQVINFRTHCAVPVEKLCIALNRHLPPSVRATGADEVSSDFNARHSAVSRHYRYDIVNAPVCDAITGRFAWHVKSPLNVTVMGDAARKLIGVHDFTSFSSASEDEGCMIRRVDEIGIREAGNHIFVDVWANAFLRSMVRKIVGTLFEAGIGRRTPEEVAAMLKAADRKCTDKLAPANGLCLWEVRYSEKDV
ncbi:MAG: tRNA pseudouridine(38-40) synthase TruA [Abditibacteriota bacterium]|nr:tRNA pseudouridine(38-40) synthase TruA [Abditibacteriota bacterium]